MEVVQALLEAGGRDLAMLRATNGFTCFEGAEQGGITRSLQEACKHIGMSQDEIADLKKS